MSLNETEKQKRKVRISCLYHGRAKSAPDASLSLYASLYDAQECGELLISSTFEDILNKCKQCDYVIVK